MNRQSVTSVPNQLRALYFTRFAGSFGFVTLLTLLPFYVNELGAEGVTVGLFATGLTLAQGIAVVPITWAGDRYDKRTILLAGLGLAVAVYGAFTLVGTTTQFIAVRVLQGVAATATGVLGLSLVGQLASESARANTIGKSNSWRFAAGIGGTLSAGALYQAFGFSTVLGLVALITGIAFLAVVLFVERDDTTVEGFAFTGLALNRRILTITSFRAQYAVSVTLVRTWVPLFAGVAAAKGGLAYSGIAVGTVVAAEKFTNMLSQPITGRLSDRSGRAKFVFLGGLAYGLVALVVPFTPAIGTALSLPATYPLIGPLSPAFLPLVAMNALLGVADSVREPASMALFADEGAGEGVASSFGVRDVVWRPGSILAPIAGGWIMGNVGMEWVFFLGAGAAFSGVAAFLGILSYTHGRRALAEW